MGIQMRLNSQQNNPPNPLHLTASRKERSALKVFTLIFRGGSEPPNWIWRASSPNLDGHGYRKPSNRQHTIPMRKVGWLLNPYDVPDYFKLGLLWEESSTNNHLLGPKPSAASERSSGRHTLSERKYKHGFCAWVWYKKSLELKYLSFALRTTGSFTRSITGWFRPHVSGGAAQGFQTVFFKAWGANPIDIVIIMGQFFFWSTFLITEHKIAKKSHRNYQTWPALNIQLCVIWCFSEGFSLF